MARDQLKLMESAIVLAEELNFSRAARRLHISQPALTKQIAELEDRLHVQLFDRDKQTVRLTDAGRAYIEEARLCVFHGKRATQAVHAAAREIESVLSIGRSPYIDPFLVSTLLTVRLPLFPHLKLDLPSRFSLDLVHDVLAGTLDLAMVTDPPESPVLSTVLISESPFFITMSAEDDLAQRQQLALDDLSGREWVLFESHVHPPLYEQILNLAEKARGTSDKDPPRRRGRRGSAVHRALGRHSISGQIGCTASHEDGFFPVATRGSFTSPERRHPSTQDLHRIACGQ
jgi:DNA-binding transcriptional LysR family regulator